MPNLSDAGNQLVQTLSQRHGVSTDGATHMLFAIHRGNGSMAQFNHPDFGGSGQWMRGGMTMVSDLFNNQLKYRVDSICSDIANELANHQTSAFSGSFQSQSQNGINSQMQAGGGATTSGNSLFLPDPEANWWPQEMGIPNALGAQNNVRYAYFAQSCRLAVKTGGDVWVYDTGHHQIGGFSQQQGMVGAITFTSQFGVVSLATLPVVVRNGVPQTAPLPEPAPTPMNAFASEDRPSSVTPAPPATTIPPVSQAPSLSPSTAADIFAALERLGELRDKGYVTDDEFNLKKTDLLNRL